MNVFYIIIAFVPLAFTVILLGTYLFGKIIKSFFITTGRYILMYIHGKKCGWIFDCSNCKKDCYFK